MPNLASGLVGSKKKSYQAKQDTARLIRAVTQFRPIEGLSGDDIWNLIRLTWISRNRHGVSPNHWKKLKIPALEGLFERPTSILPSVQATVNAMGLPPVVAKEAARRTGIVNFRPT